MKLSNILPVIAMLFVTALPLTTQAQCKSYYKKSCVPLLAPFTHNGQANSAILTAGQTAEMQMTFYSNQEYRIMVCAQEVLGKVWFRLLDSDKEEVFNSKSYNHLRSWDFKMAVTQQLTIEINIPPSDSPNSIVPSGCVALLVGFKN